MQTPVVVPSAPAAPAPLARSVAAAARPQTASPVAGPVVRTFPSAIACFKARLRPAMERFAATSADGPTVVLDGLSMEEVEAVLEDWARSDALLGGLWPKLAAKGGSLAILELTGGPVHEGMVAELLKQQGVYLDNHGNMSINTSHSWTRYRPTSEVWAADIAFKPMYVRRPDQAPLVFPRPPVQPADRIPTVLVELIVTRPTNSVKARRIYGDRFAHSQLREMILIRIHRTDLSAVAVRYSKIGPDIVVSEALLFGLPLPALPDTPGGASAAVVAEWEADIDADAARPAPLPAVRRADWVYRPPARDPPNRVRICAPYPAPATITIPAAAICCNAVDRFGNAFLAGAGAQLDLGLGLMKAVGNAVGEGEAVPPEIIDV